MSRLLDDIRRQPPAALLRDAGLIAIATIGSAASIALMILAVIWLYQGLCA